MDNSYIGQIRMFGGNFAPAGWAFCDGQLLSIAEYETLFTLIGTTYGGDGVDTFALPDLRGRTPIHVGGNFVNGEQVVVTKSGDESAPKTPPFLAVNFIICLYGIYPTQS